MARCEGATVSGGSKGVRPTAIAPRLLQDHGRTLFTPHLGSAVAMVRAQIEAAAAAEIVRFAKGEPLLNRVN